MRLFTGWFCGAGVAIFGLAGVSLGEEPKSASAATLNELSMEVSALQILHHLNVTPNQLTALRKLAAHTAAKNQDPKPGKGSEKLRAALVEMHKALLENKEAEHIDGLTDKVNTLRDQ